MTSGTTFSADRQWSKRCSAGFAITATPYASKAPRCVIRKVEENVGGNPISHEEFIRAVLRAYCTTPGTTGGIRRQDRLLYAQLYDLGVALLALQNTFLLSA